LVFVQAEGYSDEPSERLILHYQVAEVRIPNRALIAGFARLLYLSPSNLRYGTETPTSCVSNRRSKSARINSGLGFHQGLAAPPARAAHPNTHPDFVPMVFNFAANR
jgi:hypothetical protein